MLFSSWLRNWKRFAPEARRRSKQPLANGPASAHGWKGWKTAGFPAATSRSTWSATSPASAHSTDSNLNGWGMTSMPDGSFVVANAFTTGLATFYDRSGHVLPQTITVPETKNSTALASAGLVFTPAGTATPPASSTTRRRTS